MCPAPVLITLLTFSGKVPLQGVNCVDSSRCAKFTHIPIISANFPLVLTNSSINPIGLLMHFSRIRFNGKIRVPAL